jgi:THO complex subunit 2
MSSDRKRLKDKLMSSIDRLVTEQKDQVAHRKAIFERLDQQKHKFFTTEHEIGVLELLQKCVIPRALLSPEDALYCAKFMHHMHSIDTPNLNTLRYFDKVTKNLSGLVLCTTEREAQNFGIFLKETHVILSRWSQSPDDFEKEGSRAGLRYFLFHSF